MQKVTPIRFSDINRALSPLLGCGLVQTRMCLLHTFDKPLLMVVLQIYQMLKRGVY